MFKELAFEILGRPRGRHACDLYEHALKARSQVIHATPSTCWELIHVIGAHPHVAAHIRRLEMTPEAPMRDVEVVSTAEGDARYVVSWDRPDEADAPVTLPFLLHDTAGPEAMFHSLIEERRMRVRVAGPDGAKLLDYFETVDEALADRFQVRLLRAGGFSPDLLSAMPAATSGTEGAVMEPASILGHVGALKTEDRHLVALALAAGYYDNPKRCGVRELGEAVGCSKSVIARKLRVIERTALEALMGPGASKLDSEPEPPRGPA